MEVNIEMNQLSKRASNPKGMVQYIDEAFCNGIITKDRTAELYSEIEKLARFLVNYLNHGSSTSLSLENFERITRAIDYLFMHGFEVLGYDARQLNQRTISAIYHVGITKVKEDVQLIIKTLESIKHIQLPFKNERYLSIINEQYPTYLKLLDSYEAILHYHNIDEDLDYPLIDGLPLYHEMYHLQGTDLAFYYLKRFYTEIKFCQPYQKSIKELVSCYEKLKGVEIEYLGVNLYEVILNQVVGSYLLNQKGKVIFEEAEIEIIKDRLLKATIIEETISSILKMISQDLEEEGAAYLERYKRTTIHSFKQFVFDDFDLLIYHQILPEQNIILLDPPESNLIFLRTLELLQVMSDVSDKINYLQSISISIYDVIDLLENEIFIDLEYGLYYKTFSATEIAVMIKILNPTLAAFHHKHQLNEQFYQEFDTSKVWIHHFVIFLRSQDIEKKIDIEKVLNHVNVIDYS